ncbi:hypothetical protein SAMN05216199_1257 [Pedococcus cremeus]|uniref:Uncharacterized protein n=1 Tax=Pedococcus cremeus TaxID=587636 RepID=A0A1H9S4E7_9MICO|nr:hypothetical protein [Pedococcus cremeus]SER79936.1 hypothetical protein SAMN05216199_1257 [Pedococcus cremeus]
MIDTNPTPPPMKHRADCPGADLSHRIGEKGDRVWWCNGCRYFAIEYLAEDGVPKCGRCGGRRQATKRLCAKCAKAGIQAQSEAQAADTAETEAAKPQTATSTAHRYRCREHHDQVVTWKGKGCQPCTRAARTPRRRSNNSTDFLEFAGETP